MKVTKFNDKLNYLQNNIYTIEEVLHPVGGVVESVLIHDNIAEDSINVYTGSKLTGDKIKTFVISTPSKAPWTTSIKIFSDLDTVYVTYETKGDTVEADDVNNLQTAVNETQTALNVEIDRSVKADKLLTDNLNSEISRAKREESTIANNLNNEINRATNRENALNTSLDAEIKRAKAKETEINNALTAEINRATTKENSINTALNNEVSRAKSAESTITTNLNNEVTRAKGAESTITNNLNAEIARATARENAINADLTAEVTRAKAKEAEIDTALSDRYTKSEVFTKSEVLAKIQDLINSAPEVLDTFGEIAEALGNDPNFASTMTTMLSQKVDKVSGKALSTNDFDNTQKSNLADAYNKRHTHDNKSVIDGITSALVNTWNNAYTHISDAVKHITSTERSNWNDANTKKHTHDNKSALDGITSALITNWNNAYSHISDAVKHITSSERTLWNTVSNKLDKTANAVSASKLQTARTISLGENLIGSTTFDGSGNVTINGRINRVNLTGTTTDLNSLNNSNGVASRQYIELTTGGCANISNAPVKEPFILDVESIRWVSTSDYITKQTFTSATAKRVYERYCTNGTWSSWSQVYTTNNKPSKADIGLGNVDNTSDLNKPISTATQTALNGKANASHTHTKSQITDMPTKLSQFTNDAGYITQAQVDTSQNHTHSNKTVLDGITSAKITEWNGKANSNHTHNNYVTLKRFDSSHTGTENHNKWTKIANLKVTGRYQDVNALFFIHETSHGGGATRHGMIFCRLKQQEEMGSPPNLQLRLFNESGMTAEQIKMVVVSNTTSETVVEIYYKICGTHSIVNGKVLEQAGGGVVNVFSNQPLITNLPTGTTKGAYRKAFTWNDLKGV